MRGKFYWWLILGFAVIAGSIACSKNGEIEVNSTPGGADVYLDDTLQDEKTNCILSKISPGEHTVRVSLDGYSAWEERITLEEGETVTIDAVLNEPSTLIWKYETGGWVGTCPAIASDGTIYFSSDDGFLYALNFDGTLKWKYEIGSSSRSDPTIHPEGYVCFGANDSNFYMLDTDGQLYFKYKTTGPITNSPAVTSEGGIYVLSGCFFCALKTDKTVSWTSDTLSTTTFSSLAIASDGKIFFTGLIGGLYAMSPGGEVLWTHAMQSSFQPSIGSDDAVYAAQNSFFAFTPTGDLKWRCDSTWNAIRSSAATDEDGTIFFTTSDGYVYALDPSNGALKWRYTGHPATSVLSSSPAVGSDGTIFVGTGDSYLSALNPDGTVLWEYDTKESFIGSPAIATTGVVYVGAGNNLYAFASASRGLASSSWPKYQHDAQNTGSQ